MRLEVKFSSSEIGKSIILDENANPRLLPSHQKSIEGKKAYNELLISKVKELLGKKLKFTIDEGF